jgi:hypothetical protein
MGFTTSVKQNVICRACAGRCRIAAFGPSKQIKTACLNFDLKVDQNKRTPAVVFLAKMLEIAIFHI